MNNKELARYELGDTVAIYLSGENNGAPGLIMVPRSRLKDRVEWRENLEEDCIGQLPETWLPMPAREIDPLAHLHIRGDARPGGFSQGRSLRNSRSIKKLRLEDHSVTRDGMNTVIKTRLNSDRGCCVIHKLSHTEGEMGVRIKTFLRNESDQPITVEMLSAFSLGAITPFDRGDASERLFAHRLRSAWSAEGRHECQSIEELQLERSWSGTGVSCERFGQTGSMPVNGWFPFIGIEDRAAGVFWGAQIEAPGSWQIEIYRRDDQLSISGGLADREVGHWWKTLDPGMEIASPEARLASVSGSFDELTNRLTSMQRPAALVQPSIERDMPIVFNEWCVSWGNPTHETLLAVADKLANSGARYIVIDDGWAGRDSDVLTQQNGDWEVDREAFPDGLSATCSALRERGFIPGIWFEHEVVNAGTEAFDETAHQLHLDGVPLQVGSRRFWDFRDPWVHDYLSRKLIAFLRDNGFGYLKIDYNETIGLGCDGSESPGEGLRQHLEGVQTFLTKIRNELPELVIENCSSGGHRLEPSFQALTAMGCFSDAHETPEIPIVAANVHRAILPRQSQVWAVLRKQDSTQRICYSLAAGFLGRLCLSGQILDLSEVQWTLTRQALDLYQELSPIIANSDFRRFGEWGKSYRHPSGWQAVVAHYEGEAFVVWHTFENAPAEVSVPLAQERQYRIKHELADPASASTAFVDGARLELRPGSDWRGGVISLTS